MTFIMRDIDWFDLEGHKALLADLRALPKSDIRDRQIEGVEQHIASILPFSDTPEKSPKSGVEGGLGATAP